MALNIWLLLELLSNISDKIFSTEILLGFVMSQLMVNEQKRNYIIKRKLKSKYKQISLVCVNVCHSKAQ